MLTILYPQVYVGTVLMLVVMWIMWKRFQSTNAVLLSMYTTRYLKRIPLLRIFIIKICIIGLLFISVMFSLSHPQMNRGKILENKSDLTQLVIAIDVSKSMYVRDMEGHTRMEVAIDFITEILNKHDNLHIIGYLFTDRVVQAIPQTTDRIFVINFLQELKKRPMIQGSTNFEIIAEILSQKFLPLVLKNAAFNTTFMFVSDGESHTKTSDAVLESINQIVENTIVVLSGTEEGGRVRNDDNFIFTAQGDIVFSYAHKDLMKNMAQSIEGDFIDLQLSSDVPILDTPNTMYQDDIAWIGWFLSAISVFLYLCVGLL